MFWGQQSPSSSLRDFKKSDRPGKGRRSRSSVISTGARFPRLLREDAPEQRTSESKDLLLLPRVIPVTARSTIKAHSSVVYDLDGLYSAYISPASRASSTSESLATSPSVSGSTRLAATERSPRSTRCTGWSISSASTRQVQPSPAKSNSKVRLGPRKSR